MIGCKAERMCDHEQFEDVQSPLSAFDIGYVALMLPDGGRQVRLLQACFQAGRSESTRHRFLCI